MSTGISLDLCMLLSEWWTQEDMLWKAMNAVKSKRNPYRENHFTRKSPTPLATSSMHWECVEQKGTNLVSLCEETNIIYTESNFLNQSTWSHCFLNVEFTTHEPLCKHSTLNKILYCIVTNYFKIMVVGLEDFSSECKPSTLLTERTTTTDPCPRQLN